MTNEHINQAGLFQ